MNSAKSSYMSELAAFRYYLSVRYGECDQQGVVYNARYGEYVDLACTEFLNVVLGRGAIASGNFEMQVVKLLIEWTAPARFNDILEISVCTKKLGTTSFALGFEMRKVGTTQVIVTAETVNVHIEPKSWTKSPIPDAMRARLMDGARGCYIDHAGVFTPKLA